MCVYECVYARAEGGGAGGGGAFVRARACMRVCVYHVSRPLSLWRYNVIYRGIFTGIRDILHLAQSVQSAPETVLIRFQIVCLPPFSLNPCKCKNRFSRISFTATMRACVRACVCVCNMVV